MARYTGAVCRLCRREGQKLFLKGDRCYTDKCAIARRSYAPGQHGQGRKKMSEYGTQLREKQKAKFIYGVLEKQFRGYYDKALKLDGITGDNLMHHYRPGVFKIAQKANVPIVVCTLYGTQNIPANVKKLRRTHIDLHVVGVVPAEELKGVTTVDIAARVYAMMAEDLGPDKVANEK